MMIELEMHLNNLLQGVMESDSRYKLLGYDTVQDIETGLVYRLHKDKPFEIYIGDRLLLTGRGLTNGEADILEKLANYVYHNSVEIGRSQVNDILTQGVPRDTPKQANGGYEP